MQIKTYKCKFCKDLPGTTRWHIRKHLREVHRVTEKLSKHYTSEVWE